MEKAKVISSSIPKIRIKDLTALMKLKLSFLVVFSSVLGYFMGTSNPVLLELVALIFGGVLLTGGSNGFNQIWERNSDILMNRTKGRPLPSGDLSVFSAVLFCSLISILGIAILWVFLNPFCGILGVLAIYTYVLIYTPLKKINSFAVTAGAFPGAIPPMLGYVAASGSFGLEPGLLFAMQFMWQFPHFWAIAWVAESDYKAGGFKMLPFNGSKTRFSAWYIALSALVLIPVSLLPWYFGDNGAMIGNIAGISTLIFGLVFLGVGIRFAMTQQDKHAKWLMFASFFYLPLVQILYVLDKL